VKDSTLSPSEALERKQRFGKQLTYDRLSEAAGIPKTTVYVVLNERHTAIPIDREKVLKKVGDALNRLEREQALERAA
jgi:chromosome condensin MukBEF MukE localization factor